VTGNSDITKRVYQRIDRHLGQLLDKLPVNSTLIVASDHGGQGYDYVIDINKLLEQMDLLTYGDENQIDYDSTVVFHNLWCLYFNEDLLSAGELRSRGVPVADGVDPREALTRHLEGAGANLSAPDGTAFPIEFSRVSPDGRGYPPDLVVRGGYSNYLVEFWNLARPHPEPIRVREERGWDHRRDGIYIVYGKGARKGVHGPVADIQDIAPTMLYLLSLPSPSDLDGRVMAGALDPDQLHFRPRYVIEDFGALPTRAIVSDEQRESLEKKLKSLGYVH
jgi:predicted AlkP superfamily phosphohydrolase/phosphomutase